MPPQEPNTSPITPNDPTQTVSEPSAFDEVPGTDLMDQPTQEPIATDSNLEQLDTSPSQDIPVQTKESSLDDSLNEQTASPDSEMPETPESTPKDVPAEAVTQQAQPVEGSPERVSLTDLSSYKPQDDVSPALNTVVADEATKDNIYTEICTQIIKEQEQIIGALAVEQAQQVVGLTVDPVTYHCTVVGDGSKVIDDLIEQYRDFFGHAAVEVCKEAASKFVTKLPAEALPASLR